MGPYHDELRYEGMSILTRSMAYANARLVGTIDSSWLSTRFASDNKMSTTLHCSCTCHNFCDQGINPQHVHTLSDHKRRHNNDLPLNRSRASQINLNKNNIQNNIQQIDINTAQKRINNPFNNVPTTNPQNMYQQMPYAQNLLSIASNLVPINTINPFIASMPNTSVPMINNVMFNQQPINNMNNSLLTAYGIPTSGPPVNMPIAQMSGPQSIGSSMTSSVPIYPTNIYQKIVPQNNSTKIVGTPNNTINDKINSKKEEEEENKKEEKIEKEEKKIAEIEKEEDEEQKNNKKEIKEIKIKEMDKFEGRFSDDMFADASPRTKEVFNGLTFDEEDEHYSLQKDNKINTIKRAKSFHNNEYQNMLKQTNGANQGHSASWSKLQNELKIKDNDRDRLKMDNLTNSVRQHSHDGIHGLHRIKSENQINATQNNHNYGYHQNYPAYFGYHHEQNDQPSYDQQYDLFYENDKLFKNKRMFKSHSQPSLTDMMSMHADHQKFQQFQQQNIKQSASPIQEDQPSDIYLN